MIPFKMIQETETEKWRAETFWTKEAETIAWIKGFKNNEVFFDVGANIGIYSLYCAYLHPLSQILAIEPLPLNYYRLLDNISLNDFRNILGIKSTIGRSIGKVYMKIDKNESGATGTVDCGEDANILCQQFPLDCFAYIIKPNHIKIDTDGNELDVLKGMPSILMSKEIKSILIEINEDKEEIFDTFKRNDFKLDLTLNTLENHSRFRREREGVKAENYIFVRD